MSNEQEKITALESRVEVLENLLRDIKQRQALVPALPDTKLLSGNFLARAFAVLGHYIVAMLLISIPIYVLLILIIFSVGLSLFHF